MRNVTVHLRAIIWPDSPTVGSVGPAPNLLRNRESLVEQGAYATRVARVLLKLVVMSGSPLNPFGKG